jgi:hypothetical protein
MRVIAERAAHELHALADGFRGDHQSRPDALGQLIEGDEVGCGARERHQQVKREMGQGDVDPVARDALLPDVHDQVIDLKAGLRGIAVLWRARWHARCLLPGRGRKLGRFQAMLRRNTP